LVSKIISIKLQEAYLEDVQVGSDNNSKTQALGEQQTLLLDLEELPVDLEIRLQASEEVLETTIQDRAHLIVSNNKQALLVAVKITN
jgi:hypothetical protein